MKNIKKYIFIIIFSIMLFLLKLDILDLSILLDTLSLNTIFNIITINSILVGFLFSALGIFASLNRTKTYQYLSRTPYIKNTEDYMLLGILTGLLSIAFSVIYIFIDFSNIFIHIMRDSLLITLMPRVNLIFSFLIIYFLVLSLIFFSSSLKNLYLIISQERKNPKIVSSEEENRRSSLIERIKNKS